MTYKISGPGEIVRANDDKINVIIIS